MKKNAKLTTCMVGRTTDVFLQDQIKELDYDFGAAMAAASPAEQAAFYRFAAAFGCFSHEKILDENGKPTATILGQLASTVLRRLMQDDGTQAKHYQNARLRIGDFAELCRQLPKDVEPDADFVNYLRASYCDENGILRYPNFEMLLNLERGYNEKLENDAVFQHDARPGIFTQVMTNFQTAQNFRITIDHDSVPKTIPSQDAFRIFYDYDFNAGYNHVNARNRDLAKMCQSYGLPQRFFDVAVSIYGEAARNGAPHHILGKPLTESQGVHTFTYEMLDKYDPANAVLGLTCSCCSILGGIYYGSSIAEVAITERNVQNMVIRNGRGKIVAKGALYINLDQGEAVFNDFEMNCNYRGNGLKRNTIQNEIYAAFQRGTDAVVKRYNQLYPKHPMQRVTVGSDWEMTPQNFNFVPVDDQARVATDYFFQDSNTGIQYLLYQAPQTKTQMVAPQTDREL